MAPSRGIAACKLPIKGLEPENSSGNHCHKHRISSSKQKPTAPERYPQAAGSGINVNMDKTWENDNHRWFALWATTQSFTSLSFSTCSFCG